MHTWALRVVGAGRLGDHVAIRAADRAFHSGLMGVGANVPREGRGLKGAAVLTQLDWCVRAATAG